jgi:hypothetical protein
MANANLVERLLDSKGISFSAGRSVLIAFLSYALGGGSFFNIGRHCLVSILR